MRYEVTNNTKAPRVLHDVNNKGKMIAVGTTAIIDLHDHDAERLMLAKGKDEVTLSPAEPEAAPTKVDAESTKPGKK